MNSTAKKCALLLVLALAATLPSFSSLRISSEGLQLLADAEGCRLSPYQCSAGVWTNGIGHTRGVTSVTEVNERQVAVNLIDDVQRVENGIARCMAVEMPQAVYDATVSFAFNVGVGAVCRSTFARLINQRQWQAACDQLRRWVYVAGVRNKGIEARRAAEYARCIKGVP
ncbi:lysozyme [Erwinia sorbitola]|uniref:Lysozyme n=1 Tax=Erwinia sorbitola TaxID=2681984 RepID=A0A6I6EGW2_9GAMM|nr:lysozyme [Erwinia sorbitola]MTD27519.1 glycoside hydrolase family protein [Erwinia sorbitola]QGU89054.1 glycoside hydrolase family protein [Erwinia sorbitola]